jgi:hypothetical protein
LPTRATTTTWTWTRGTLHLHQKLSRARRSPPCVHGHSQNGRSSDRMAYPFLEADGYYISSHSSIHYIRFTDDTLICFALIFTSRLRRMAGDRQRHLMKRGGYDDHGLCMGYGNVNGKKGSRGITPQINEGCFMIPTVISCSDLFRLGY